MGGDALTEAPLLTRAPPTHATGKTVPMVHAVGTKPEGAATLHLPGPLGKVRGGGGGKHAHTHACMHTVMHPYMILHDTTLHYITLHYITLHCSILTSHCITLH